MTRLFSMIKTNPHARVAGRNPGVALCLLLTLSVGLMTSAVSAQTPPVYEEREEMPSQQPAQGADVGPVNGPRAVVAEPTHDFGETWVGPILEHTFTLKNTGIEPLQIKSVRPACGCTKAGDSPSVIMPGESGQFPFKLDSRKLRGKYRKSITIETNDPQNERVILRLAGVCKRYIDVEPRNAHFGRVEPNRRGYQRIIRLTNNTDTPLSLEVLPHAAEEEVSVDIVPVQTGKKYEIRFSLKMPLPPGTFREKIQIATNIEAEPTIEVTVNATMPARVDVTPSPLYFLSPNAQSVSGTRSVELINYGTNPVRVTNTSIDNEEISLTTRELDPGRRYKVDVSIPSSVEFWAAGFTLTVETDDPEFPKFEIPVRNPGAPQRVAGADGKPARKTPPKPQPRPQDLVGKPAPAFEAMESLNGASVSNEAFQGNVTVLNFVAMNCPYCKRQLPRIEEIRSTYSDKGVRFVNVVGTMRTRYSTEQAVEQMQTLGARAEVVMDPRNELGRSFNARAFPTCVVVGRDGTVEQALTGNRVDLEKQLDHSLGKALEKASSSAQAPWGTPPWEGGAVKKIKVEPGKKVIVGRGEKYEAAKAEQEAKEDQGSGSTPSASKSDK
jgi:thiol-disulfide isomerase/thioredoxin